MKSLTGKVCAQAMAVSILVLGYVNTASTVETTDIIFLIDGSGSISPDASNLEK